MPPWIRWLHRIVEAPGDFVRWLLRRNPEPIAQPILLRDLMAEAESGSPTALAYLERVYHSSLSHESTCAYRHHGPCTCRRSDVAELLDRHGRSV